MKNFSLIVKDGIAYSANMYHWRQAVPNREKYGTYGLYLCANVFNKKSKEPVKIKKISVMMGNHPNYFPSWRIGEDSRMFRENSSHHCVGPWYESQITEGTMGGQAKFLLADGEELHITDLRIPVPRNEVRIGPIPIVSIPFSLLDDVESSDSRAFSLSFFGAQNDDTDKVEIGDWLAPERA